MAIGPVLIELGQKLIKYERFITDEKILSTAFILAQFRFHSSITTDIKGNRIFLFPYSKKMNIDLTR